MRRFFLRAFVLALCIAALMPSSARAQFTVTQNLTLLSGPNNTFYLQFQLSDGSQAANQTARATISNFSLTGAILSGAGSALGGVTGNLATALILEDTDANFNGLADYLQEITVTGAPLVATYQLDFELLSGQDTPTPDSFFVFILDSSQIPLPSSGMTGTEFLAYDFTDVPGTPAVFSSQTGTSPLLPAPVVTLTPASAPEAQTHALLGLGLLTVPSLRRIVRR